MYIEIRVKVPKDMDRIEAIQIGEHLKDLMIDDQDDFETIKDITYDVKDISYPNKTVHKYQLNSEVHKLVPFDSVIEYMLENSAMSIDLAVNLLLKSKSYNPIRVGEFGFYNE